MKETSKTYIQQCFDRRITVWCARLDLNQHAERHMLLRHTCIPISPLAHGMDNEIIPQKVSACTETSELRQIKQLE